ncbi:hypothetical protein AABB24_008895 [Solanum stoloniferum]|uniref:Uncharacterized protein n=2 Tax=Solanum TaxID=4107 RepID=A0AAF0QSS1_SOLVR|nr:hypothetical protein MTR67_021392 [Solanum verrucosum]
MNWFDELFPPETRIEKINHWFYVALPYVIIAVFLGIFIYCCYYHGGLLRNIMYDLKITLVRLFNYVNNLYTSWRSSKMMKAPGRNTRIPRASFEIDPKRYFRNLRANPGDMLV